MNTNGVVDGSLFILAIFFLVGSFILWRRLIRCEQVTLTVIEKLPDATLLCDEIGKIIFANDQVKNLFNNQKLQGHELGIPIHAGDWAALDLPFKSGAVIEMKSVETQWRGKKAWVVVFRDVTEALKAEKNKSQVLLRRMEDRYQALYEGSPDALAICTAPDFRLRDANHALRKMLNMDSKKELESVEIFDLAPCSSTSFRKNTYQKIAENGCLEFELEIMCRTGKQIDTCVTFSKLDTPANSYLLNIRDVTEKKQADSRIRESEKQVSRALQLAKAGQWIYEYDSDLFIFNDNFYRIFDITPQEVGGYRMKAKDYAQRFIPLESRRLVKQEIEKIRDSTQNELFGGLEHEFIRGDGTIGYIAVTFEVERNASGRPIRLIGVNQDITERKQRDQTIADKENLIQEIHHRVKNNLQVVSGLLSLQMRSQQNNFVKENLQIALSRINSIALLHELIYRAQNLQSVPLLALVQDLSRRLQQMYKGKDCQINYLIDVDNSIMLPEKMAGPLSLILNELLTNSHKHAFHGRTEGSISITGAIQKDSETERIQIIVSDNGVGMLESTPSKGSGLGSKIMERLSSQLGATIENLPRQIGTCTAISIEINQSPS